MKQHNGAPAVKRGISVILPALNEAENIAGLATEIMDYFEIRDMPFEIIIVNDGSTDETRAIANLLASKHENISVIHHAQNKGYGKSLKDGFNAGRHEYLFFTDADRQFKINSLDAFLPLMEEGDTDMIIGYRINRKDILLRKFLAWCFNRMVCTLFPINSKDIDCAFKLFKKEVFTSLDIKSDAFLFNAEILAKAQIKQLNIVQVGVKHYPRVAGNSTISYKSISSTINSLYALYMETKRFRSTLKKKGVYHQ